MRIRSPITGRVLMTIERSRPEASVSSINIPQDNLKDKQKFVDVLGGFLTFDNGALSNEKTVSKKVLEANKDWVYRNNDVIAQEVSKMDFELYQMAIQNGDIIYQEVEEHPLLDLLDKINSTTTKSDALYTTQSHKKLSGDAFWLLKKNGNTITDIFMLPPDKVTINIADPTDASSELVTSYTYKDRINNKDIEITYPAEEIIHFKKPNPKNPFRGLGVVEAIAETIDLDNYTNYQQLQFFKNGAITNFVLKTDNRINEDQIKRLEAKMKNAHTGPRNWFKTLIFGGGLTPVDISYSNKDMQMLDSMEWWRDKIMIGFGNTKASLGVIDDVNRASYEGSMVGWLRNTVKPDMDSIVGTLNEFLVPMFGNNLVLGYNDPVPMDRTDDITEATQLVQAQIMTVNEARELVGLEAIDGGDVFVTPLGNNPADMNEPPDEEQIDEEIEDADEDEADDSEKMNKRIYRKQISRLNAGNVPSSVAHIANIKSILRSRKIFTQRQVNKEIKELVKPMIKDLIKQGKSEEEAIQIATKSQISPHFENDVIDDHVAKRLHIVEVYEKQFEKAVEKFIGHIEEKVLASFDSAINGKAYAKRAINKFASSDLGLDDEEFQVQAQLDLTPVLINEAVLAGTEAYKLLGHDAIYQPFALHDKIADNVRKFTQSMLDTDREKLVDLIQNGIDDGMSVPQIRSSITEEFDNINKVQAQRITRTEVLRVNNQASEDAYVQSGLVEAKQWLTAGDPDEECAQFEGQIVTLGGDFYASDNEFQDGDPPLHPNCRCVIIPILTDSGSKSLTNKKKQPKNKAGN